MTLTLLAPAAQADERAAQQHIDAALKAAAELEYELALSELELGLATEGISEGQRLQAHYRAGVVCRIIGKDVDARNHFMWVLRREPSITVPDDTPPKIRLFFEAAREDALAEARVTEQTEEARRLSQEARDTQSAAALEAEEREQQRRARRKAERDLEDADNREDEKGPPRGDTNWGAWSLVAGGGITAVLGMVLMPIAGVGGMVTWLASESRANDYEDAYVLAGSSSEREQIRQDAAQHQNSYTFSALLLTILLDLAIVATLVGVGSIVAGGTWVVIAGAAQE